MIAKPLCGGRENISIVVIDVIGIFVLFHGESHLLTVLVDSRRLGSVRSASVQRRGVEPRGCDVV